jgi:hypothetical protein
LGPSVYSLTDLTGRRKNAGRTMIISGIEIGRRTLIVTSVSFVASLLPMLLLFPLLGALTFVTVPPVFIIVGFVFFEARTRKGLQLRRYEAFLDKRKVDPNIFFVCFQPVSAGLGFGRIVNSAETVRRPLENSPTAVFTPSRRTAGKRKPV